MNSADEFDPLADLLGKRAGTRPMQRCAKAHLPKRCRCCGGED